MRKLLTGNNSIYQMFSAIRNTRILIVHVNKKDNTDVNT